MKQPESIRSELLRAGHIAGLKFDEGWWFIQCIGTEYVEVKPWILLNENGNRDVVGASTSGANDQNIVDSSGNDKILMPDDSARNTVHQIFYGVDPSRMQLFSLFGRDRNVALQDYDQPGEVGGYINGFDSPYDNPSPSTELFYINSMAPLRLQPYNPMSTAKEARVSFHVNKVRYTTITSEDKQKALLQGQEPAKLEMMGLGVQDADQVSIPTWLNEAFGEHIRTTSEILDSNTEGNAPVQQREAASSSDLRRRQP